MRTGHGGARISTLRRALRTHGACDHGAGLHSGDEIGFSEVGSIIDLDVADHYTEALHEVVAAKAEHRALMAVTEEAAPAGQVVDLTGRAGAVGGRRPRTPRRDVCG
ncbi:hypothetical protein ACFUAG_32715 [Streptomyces sp. NPDC057193]|uniref:hypothetical protein n=1 Tax=unclassified Streptomyces TaxID=2593676 RepID=UPI00093DF351|nr:hypothetical protein [Streptomyces sp. CB02261]OKJ64247.1 hypothetical protein AMK29_19615 [Streptomyces sp. CB02261]